LSTHPDINVCSVAADLKKPNQLGQWSSTDGQHSARAGRERQRQVRGEPDADTESILQAIAMVRGEEDGLETDA